MFTLSWLSTHIWVDNHDKVKHKTMCISYFIVTKVIQSSIFFRVPLMALGQLYDSLSAVKPTWRIWANWIGTYPQENTIKHELSIYSLGQTLPYLWQKGSVCVCIRNGSVGFNVWSISCCNLWSLCAFIRERSHEDYVLMCGIIGYRRSD